MKIASSVAHFDHLVYIVSVNQGYSNTFFKWPFLYCKTSINVNKNQIEKLYLNHLPYWIHFYSKSLSVVKSPHCSLKLFTREKELTHLGLHHTLCVLFLSRNCSFLSTVKFTVNILLEWWPCLFYHTFEWFCGTSRFKLHLSK